VSWVVGNAEFDMMWFVGGVEELMRLSSSSLNARCLDIAVGRRCDSKRPPRKTQPKLRSRISSGQSPPKLKPMFSTAGFGTKEADLDGGGWEAG
jgi:hypothetical protein